MIFKRYHCRPVHFSILDARTLNVVPTPWVLSRVTTIRVESVNLLNIPNACCDAVACGGYRMLVPLSCLWLASVLVVLGLGGVCFDIWGLTGGFMMSLKGL